MIRGTALGTDMLIATRLPEGAVHVGFGFVPFPTGLVIVLEARTLCGGSA